MTLSGIIYHDVEESFRMAGPYMGTLNFKGQFLNGRFLADGERLSQDKRKLIFSRFVGVRKSGLFGLGSQRMFHILIYDEIEDEFYQSVKSYECLAIERMEDKVITFHEAFHTSTDEFKQTIEFNENNFKKIEKGILFTTINKAH